MNYNDLKENFSKNSILLSFSEEDKIKIYNKFKDCFEIAKDGYPNFKLENKYLYSKYRPSEKFTKIDFINKDKLIIIENGIGLSFYYYLNYIKSSEADYFNQNILIVYASNFSFLASLFIIDYAKINIKNLLIFIFNKHEENDYIIQYFNKNSKVKFRLPTQINYNFIDNPEFFNIKENIKLVLSENYNFFKDLLIKFLLTNLSEKNDLEKFKFYFENSLNFQKNKLERIQNLIEIINNEIQKHIKSLLTEKYFSIQWERNINKNLKLIKEKGWDIYTNKINFDFNIKKGIIFWGASYSTEEFLRDLNDKQINIIQNEFYSISITSSVNLLKKYGIQPDYQALFDAGIFGYYNIEDYSIPLICSMIIHPIIIKKQIISPIFINLLTEEENEFKELNSLIIFPFYGATLPTLYKGFKDLLANYEIKLYLVGSGFKEDEKITHHKNYPLYKYIISREVYFSPLLNWETIQKLNNINKFKVYRISLEKLDVLDEKDLLKKINEL